MEKKWTRIYETDEIRVFWDAEACTHASECWKANIKVFDPRRKPWVDLTGAPAKEIARVIDLCPSGALAYEWKS
ncbi:MAG: (4Fe-4S)-binding protein [Parasporobacterium sp.]|nr:(4Fe-4S)-binding protein [Parasporobacterium sp.]MBQ9032975.1 (4Fe-4S)-binding protein [Parasporobacterium sp.]